MRGLALIAAASGVLGCKGFSEVASGDAAMIDAARGDASIDHGSRVDAATDAKLTDAVVNEAAADAPLPDAQAEAVPSDAPVAAARTGKIVFTSTRDGTPHIYVANADGTDIHRVTTGNEKEEAASWSPDNQRIVFARTAYWPNQIWVVNADGTGLTRMPYDGRYPSWHPDGTRILATVSASGLLDFAVDGSNATMITLPSKVPYSSGMSDVAGWWQVKWSPDGTCLAVSFDIYEDPSTTVDVIRFLDADGVHIRTPSHGYDGGGYAPAWSPDGMSIVAWDGSGIGYYGASVGGASTTFIPGGWHNTAPINVQADPAKDADWAPDGRSIVVPIRQDGHFHLYNYDLATKVTAPLIPAGAGDDFDPSWSH